MDGKSQMIKLLDATKDSQVEFLQQFVRAKSPNPPGDTAAAAAVVTQFLAARGIPFDVIEPQLGVVNIISDFHGGKTPSSSSSASVDADPGPRVILNGHLDVLPVTTDTQDDWDRDPWSGDVDVPRDRIYGRGVVDMKSGTASLVIAYAHLYERQEQLRGSVSLCVVSDEETGGA